jgi:hypothetical protein
MLSSKDMAQMQADLLAVRNDRAVDIVIRRNGSNLPAQTVRIARAGMAGSNLADAGAVQGTVTGAVVLGAVSLDIKPGDRFTVNSMLYEVVAIHPNRDASTQAEAKVVQ